VPDLGGDEDGQTPVDLDDAQYLTTAHAKIGTRAELNDAEAANITDALLWLDEQELSPDDVLNSTFLRDFHRQMFADVWTWAGQFRQRDTTIGVRPAQIQEHLHAMLGDVGYWVGHKTYESSEISIRFQHRLVFIHPFVNGNGRHARLAAGALATSLGLSPDHLTWGARSGLSPADSRHRYLAALRSADRGDYSLLLENAIG